MQELKNRRMEQLVDDEILSDLDHEVLPHSATSQCTQVIRGANLAPEHAQIKFFPHYQNSYFIRDLSSRDEQEQDSLFSQDSEGRPNLSGEVNSGTWVSLPYNMISSDLWFSLHEDENYNH